MKPSDAIKDKHAVINFIVIKHGFSNPRIYGSVVRGEDHEGSDLDILVERGTGRCTLITIGKLCRELSKVLGVEVDVKTSDLISEQILEYVEREAILLNG